MSEISDKRKFIKRLKEIKENLSFEDMENYNIIYRSCLDIENEYGDFGLLDRVASSDFIADDEMYDLIKANSDSIDRLRCFIGDTESASIYKIDGYGNLENVSSGDFEDLCDELIKMTTDNIEELKDYEL